MNEPTQTNLLQTFKHYPFNFSDLPIEVIETDPDQPRKTFGYRAGGDHTHLLKSIQYYGIEDPIKVSEIAEGRYLIIDGHRRFSCAIELGLTTIPCRIYPKMKDGEFEARRYEMQNNRRDWKPIEKANCLHKIKVEYKDASPKEIADMVGISQTMLFHFTELRDMRLEYLELMSEYNLKEHQRVSFLRLLRTLRKIKQYQVDDIVKIIFQKIKDNLLYRRSDFVSLSKIFLTASLNEEQIVEFLSEPKMSVIELCEITQLSGLSTQIKNLIKELGVKRSLNIKLTEKEQIVFGDLYKLMETFI